MTHRPAAIFVAGMAFGDEGKGSIVDYLTRKHSVSTVVRYNGGHQAAHNVVTSDGKHHTFSQFGSGHLAGAKTFLMRDVVIDPLALAREADALTKLTGENAYSKLMVDEDCLVTTYYHRLANRVQEQDRKARGEPQHGSCGVGIGATMAYAAEYPARALRLRHLTDPDHVAKELALLREYLAQKLNITWQDHPVPLSVAADLCAEALHIDGVNVNRYQAALLAEETLIFEGAQGLLLDQHSPFFPHVTYADTTFGNIERSFPGQCFRSVRRIGVTRSYFTRHGAGPFPSEVITLKSTDVHNTTGQWQGPLRVGLLDVPLLRYAQKRLRCTEVALTHWDQFPGSVVTHKSEGAPQVRQLRMDSLQPLIESALGVPVTIISRGPRAEDKLSCPVQ